MKQLSFFIIAAALASTTSACIQAHVHWLQNSIYIGDHLDMQIWVNGQLVCAGGDDQWEETSGGADPLETKFCLQNGDGAGYGCAAGYSFCTTPRQSGGTFYYWGNKGHHPSSISALTSSCRKRPAGLSYRSDYNEQCFGHSHLPHGGRRCRYTQYSVYGEGMDCGSTHLQ